MIHCHRFSRVLILLCLNTSQLEGKYYSEIAMRYFDLKDGAPVKFLLTGGNNHREVMLISGSTANKHPDRRIICLFKICC
jgi:hypothetical protein